MRESQSPQLIRAFRLGLLIEELASTNRKNVALQLLQNERHPIRDVRIMEKAPHEAEIEKQSILGLCEGNESYIPRRLFTFLKKLNDSGHGGIGDMTIDQLSLLHSAISGIIEESMIRGAVWHALQAGRLSQRAWLLMHTILDGMSDHKLPNDILLKYVTFRSESPYVDFEGGTHLWVMHQVFSNLLKEKSNPRSAESVLIRLGEYIDGFPVPENLKKEHEQVQMGLNRVSNDLVFIDVHEMIGDDPIDNFSNIDAFFQRQLAEHGNLMALIEDYLLRFEMFICDLDDDEFYDFQP